MANYNNKIKAFTLIELSIVIIIIGLLLGAIIAGESIIYNSRIKNTVTEAQNYVTIMKVFKDKFGKYPGDYNRASAVFGCTNGSASATTLALNGCNGNGDGQVPFLTMTVLNTGNEVLRAWQHLSLAKMIDQNYTGVSSTVAGRYDTGINIPRAAVDPGGYGIDTSTTNAQFYMFLRLGVDTTTQNTGSARSPEDAKAIDFKMDDGNPVTGNVQSTQITTCFTGSGSAATWNATKAIACQIAFVITRY